MTDLTRLLPTLRVGDSVIVMKAFDVLNEGTVDNNFINESVSKYSPGEFWTLIGPDNFEHTADWADIASETDLRESLEDRAGNSVCIVREPDYNSDESSICAYVPDSDGIVRPSAY
jgi:hypothetical protein